MTRQDEYLIAAMYRVPEPKGSSAPEYARYEARLGPTAGCLLGLALGAALWAVMIGAAWWIWMLLMR